MNENKFSIDDVRKVLFAVDNQEMTVDELRVMLFKVNNSDASHDISKLQDIVNKGE